MTPCVDLENQEVDGDVNIAHITVASALINILRWDSRLHDRWTERRGRWEGKLKIRSRSGGTRIWDSDGITNLISFPFAARLSKMLSVQRSLASHERLDSLRSW